MPDDELLYAALKATIDKIPSCDKKNLFLGFVAPMLVDGLTPKPTDDERRKIGKFVMSLMNGDDWKICAKAFAEEVCGR